jgi:hypothetical protein
MTFETYNDGVSYLVRVTMDDESIRHLNFWHEPTQEDVEAAVTRLLLDEEVTIIPE